MFEKLVTKIKNSKSQRFSLAKHRFSTSDFSFKFPSQSFDFTHLLQSLRSRRSSLRTQALKYNVTNFKLYGDLRTRANQMRRIMNKRMIRGLLALVVAGYLAYQYNPYMTEIKIYCDNNEFNSKLLSSLKSLSEMHFYPSLLGWLPLMQSIMNKFAPPTGVTYTRDVIPLQDGGQIVLDWSLPVKKLDFEGTPLHGRFYPYQPVNNTKILFIIHGLTGGSETNYIQTLVDAGRRHGYRVAVFNQRGVNQPLTTPFPFHGGKLDDFKVALDYVKSKYPDAPIVALGTSFGGNQLIRYLGEKMNDSGLAAGCLLSAPFDIDDCVDGMEKTVYEMFFIRNYFEKNFLPNFDILQSLTETHGLNMENILRVKGLRDFHTHFTVKLYEHKDVKEYFETTKVGSSHILNVKVPLLILHAKDDPIAPSSSIPVDVLQKNPNIIFAETQYGSHLCWFTGLRPKRVSYLISWK